ncbi:MAG: tRNA uridine-5-carboxymethylaminomethyl(34) synthesis GTPase MnmE [Verrucomicrobiales bacterium]|nr:tRNA uridine-5-carboxymethylaminomethyl(34) synthesis GTPase MnmE [Verrucomicrobiales bacterium]
MNPEDTIAAICTPLGEGGLAVIRVSGSHSLAVTDRCFEPRGTLARKPSAAATHTVHYGRIHHQGRLADEVLLTVLRAPHSYTCEDTVEVSCHGGLLTARLVLEALLAAGARPAEPGEFTRRAFLNGRLDLAQAEAVADVIHARTELALTAAQEQLAGSLSKRIRQLRQDLLQVLAHVEAHIDFPDEDIAPDTREALLGRLRSAEAFMDELLRTAREGRLLRRGIRAALIGRTNAGKSSLLNALLGRDRAIVTATPGTTRDTIEETASIRGLPVVLIDTAGLREAGDAIEEEGIRRSQRALAEAELVLHVLDGSEPRDVRDEGWMERLADRPRIVVLNKSDLPGRAGLAAQAGLRVVETSCLTRVGIETLKDAIRETVWSGAIRAEMLEVTINARHQDALRRAREAVELTLAALERGESLELVAVDLHAAVRAVGEIVGETTTDDLLDSIFSQFCIGK